MSGAHIGDEIDACLDGALTEARRRAVLAHAESCSECGRALERASRLQQALGRIPVPDPGTTYWSEFTARVEARIAPRAIAPGVARGAANFYERLLGWVAAPGRFGWAGVVGTVAAATLVVYVGLRGFQPRDAHVQDTRPAPAPAPAPVPAPAAAPEPAPTTREPLEARAPEAGAPLAANEPVQATRRKAGNAAAPVPSKAKDQSAPGMASDEVRAIGKAKAVPRDETPLAAPGPVAAERSDAAGAVLQEEDARRDPVADFVRAAVAGDSITANATYAALTANGFAGVTRDDAERLRSWAAAPAPQAPGVIDKSLALRKVTDALRAAPRPVPEPPAGRATSTLAAPQSADAMRPNFDAGSAALPRLEPLLALEALAWPRRTDATLRPALAALAEKLARSAPNDARAAARAAALADWLAETSPSRQERDQWDTLRQNIPQR